MNNRIPGSSYDNPIWYRNYRIYISNDLQNFPYEFVHNDFDHAPDAHDRRCGHGRSVKDCEMEINQIEGEE